MSHGTIVSAYTHPEHVNWESRAQLSCANRIQPLPTMFLRSSVYLAVAIVEFSPITNNFPFERKGKKTILGHFVRSYKSHRD